MKNLKIWQKLGLMGLIFMVPFVLTTSKMIAEVNALGVDPYVSVVLSAIVLFVLGIVINTILFRWVERLEDCLREPPRNGLVSRRRPARRLRRAGRP